MTGVLTLSVFFPAVVKPPGHGFPSPRVFGGVMKDAVWVIIHVVGALDVLAMVGVAWVLLHRRLEASGVLFRRVLHISVLSICLLILGWLGLETFSAAWRVTSRNENDPASVAVGRFARTSLPENAVLLCEWMQGYEHLKIMFYADRTCYPIGGDAKARQVVQAGGIPYIVTYRALPHPHERVFVSGAYGPAVYRWQER